MEAARDSLCQLAQLVAREKLPQLGLADQNDLQELLRARLEIREEPHLLEHIRRKVLRFVDDKNDAPPACMRAQQVVIQNIDQILHALRRRVRNTNPELLADCQQKLRRRDARIQDQ